MSSVQNPRIFFKDPELQSSTVVKNKSGEPQVISGNFASVYRFEGKGKSTAVRCFLNPTTTQKERYEELSIYLANYNLSCFVRFHYDEEGILVKGKFYPIINMEWIEGKQLDDYIREHLNDKRVLIEISEKFRNVLSQLRSARINHGDLQHGNILIMSDGNIKLIDYDGIYIPPFSEFKSLENGHSNYQHPMRDGNLFGNDIDNFSGVIIYLSLIAIAADPSLFVKFNNPDNIIFTASDFKSPANSELIRILSNSQDRTVKICLNQVLDGLNKDPLVFPDLEYVLTTPYQPRAAVPQSPRAAVPQSPRAAVPQSPRAAVPQSPRAAVPQSPRAVVPQSPRAVVPPSGNKTKILGSMAGGIAALFIVYIFIIQPATQAPVVSTPIVPVTYPQLVKNSTTDGQIKYLGYKDSKNGISILHPGSWTPDTTDPAYLKGDNIVTFTRGDNGTGTSKVNFIVAVRDVGGIKLTATFLRKMMLPEIRKNENFTLLTPSSISSEIPKKLGGKDAYALIYSTDNYLNLQVGTIFRGKAYFVVYSTTTSEFYDNYNTAKEMIASFKLI